LIWWLARNRPVELAAARGEHAHVLILSGPPQFREQPALPNAGRTLDKSEPTTPTRGILKRRPK
jgi:hypothetical protein